MRLKVPNLSPRYHPFNFETKCSATFHPSVLSFTLRNQISQLKSVFYNQWNLNKHPFTDLVKWIEHLATSAISLSHHLKHNGITTVLIGLVKSHFYPNHIWEPLVGNLALLLDRTPPKYQSLSLWAISVKLANSRIQKYNSHDYISGQLQVIDLDVYRNYFENLEKRIIDSASEYTGKDIATFSSAVNNICEHHLHETPFVDYLSGSFKLLVHNLIQNKHRLAFNECSAVLKASKILSHRPNSLIMHLVASMHLSLVTRGNIRIGDLQNAFEFLPSGRIRHSMGVDTPLSREIASLAILLCKEIDKFRICNKLAIIIAETIIRTRIRDEVPQTVCNIVETLAKVTNTERVTKALKELSTN